MKTLKEQVNDLNENQNHILEAVQDIIEGQENIDEIIVKNSDDIICL